MPFSLQLRRAGEPALQPMKVLAAEFHDSQWRLLVLVGNKLITISVAEVVEAMEVPGSPIP